MTTIPAIANLDLERVVGGSCGGGIFYIQPGGAWGRTAQAGQAGSYRVFKHEGGPTFESNLDCRGS